jgi:Helix-turn-helix domain
MSETIYGGGRWGRAPAWWLQHPDTNLDLIGVLCALCTYADKDGFCEPSQATIARQLKRSRPWVNRVIADLTALGFIEKEMRQRKHNNGTTSCRYRILAEPRHNDTHVTEVTEQVPGEDTPRHHDDTTHLYQEHKQTPLASAREAEPNKSRSKKEGEPASIAINDEFSEIPAAWKPSDEATKRASLLYPEIDLAVHAAMFVHKCRAKNHRCMPGRLDDLWLSWVANDRLRDDKDIRSAPTKSSKSGASPRPADRAEERFDAWAMAAMTKATPSIDPWSKKCS